MVRKYIVVTGGVLSGLGKGVAAASIGNILSPSYKVVPVKCDGYLNVDPGTMNPIEHGEVFVLDDGSEVDMDFGHYERFLGVTCEGGWNLTMGKVFDEIRKKERRGDYLGKTVQMIPHVSNFIRDYILNIGKDSNADVVMVEIGGTIGDIENELYIEAVRNLSRKVGRENVLFVHLTYVPIPHGVDEQKSKPTQQSVNLLRQKGIEPDIVIARCSEMLTESIKGKIAKFGNLDGGSVFTGKDVDNVYEIPISFEEQGMSQLIARRLNMPIKVDLSRWKCLVDKMCCAGKEVSIGIAGKYTSLEDSYASVVEALKHAGANLGARVKVKWIDTEGDLDELDEVDGVIVPGGFGSRGIEGKIDVVSYCRKNDIPFLGICYGLQMAVIEFARNVCDLEGANTTEVDSSTKFPVVDILEEQKVILEKGGTMRLGAYEAALHPGTRVHKLYSEGSSLTGGSKTSSLGGSASLEAGRGKEELLVSERHRHRYEVNPEYHKVLEEKGMKFSGMSPDRKLVEFLELSGHPYFVATQAHPELKSSLLKPAPLFMGLVEAAMGKVVGNRV